MPKIIENLKQRLREEAFRQIEESGCDAMTIQSVAKKCGVGVGTVYNYYPSKDAILSDYILMEWEKCFAVIRTVSYYAQNYDMVIHCLYDQITALNRHLAVLFGDDAAVMRLTERISADMARALRKFCVGDVEAEIIAEALLTWIRTGKSLEDIRNTIEKLF